MTTKAKTLVIVIIVFSLLAGVVVCAPYLLVRRDEPVKSDIIIMHLGGRTAQKKKEVLKLLEEGYAGHLAIPAYGKITDVSKQLPMTPKKANRTLFKGRLVRPTNYPRYYEETHIEILEAKKLIDNAGFRSVIFVSSPYHMRRIGIIADEVFGSTGYQLAFVPSREKYSGWKWLFKKRERKFVFSEYSKIIWFTLYRFFQDN